MPVDELRHSLSEARAALEALDLRLRGRLTDDERPLVNHLHRCFHRFEEVVDAVLAYERAQEPARQDAVDLEDVLAVARALLAHRLPADGRLVISDLPVVRGDRTLLLALFRHLLENAVKFRSPDRPLEIHLDAYATDEDHWLLVIADNGIGIPIEDLDRVFHMFEQADPARTPGQGVGLAAAKRIADAHGGMIWAERNDLHGTRVNVTLPGVSVRTDPERRRPGHRNLRRLA